MFGSVTVKLKTSLAVIVPPTVRVVTPLVESEKVRGFRPPFQVTVNTGVDTVELIPKAFKMTLALISVLKAVPIALIVSLDKTVLGTNILAGLISTLPYSLATPKVVPDTLTLPASGLELTVKTAAFEVATNPAPVRVVLALTNAASPAAMLVVVSPERTV